MEISKKNWKYIKVKGVCPRCGSEVFIGMCGFYGATNQCGYVPMCSNENCEEWVGYGGDIKIRFINHKTVKVDGLWDE